MVPPTAIQKLKNFNVLGEHNSSGLGAPDAIILPPAEFLQKSKGSSNEDIPMYANASLSGKGNTYNPAPQTRYDTASNKTSYHPEAYKEKDGEAAVEEEGDALGTNTNTTEIKNNDQIITVVPMVIPD